jgi:DNA-binding MarR family transcriptional regulator
MAENSEANHIDGIITQIVSGFMLVWSRFEVTLARELDKVKEDLEGIYPARDSHPNANYELFYRVSSTLSLRGDMTMSELGSTLTVPLSTATRIADWLVDNGYVERHSDPEDRRIVRVTLTTLGRELHQTIDRYVRQRIRQVLAHLTDEECATLLKLMGKVVSSLKEEAK